MTEEIKTEVKEEKCKCFCRSEGVKKFVIVALGTFVGVYSALCLFAALHKPPCHIRHHQMIPPVEHRGHFDRGMGPDFNGKMIKKVNFDKQIPVNKGERAPFEAPKPEAK